MANKFIKLIKIHKEKIILLILAMVQILINFISNYMLILKIGFGDELSVYYIAMAVYGFLSTSIGWSISSVLTPLFIENRGKRIEGKVFFNVHIISILSLIVAIVSMYFWGKLIFTNFIGKVSYDKILIVQGLFLAVFYISTLNVVLYSIYQEKGEYIKINIINMFAAMISFIFIYFTLNEYGVYAAAASQVVTQLFIIFVMITQKGSVLKHNLIFDRENLVLVWSRMKYIFFGSLYYRTDELIERFIASYLSSGYLSLIAFIHRVYGALITVLNTSIAGPTITIFSNLVKIGDYKKIKVVLYNYITLLTTINIAIFLVIVIFGEILFLHFFSDSINESLKSVLNNILILLFSLVYGKTLGQVLQSVLLSMKLQDISTKYEMATFTISIAIKLILTIHFGIMGLLYSIVISEIIKNFAKYYLIRKEINDVI